MPQTAAASPVPYAENARLHANARDAEARLSDRVSRFRLAIFLAAAAWLVWTFSRVVTPLPVVIGVAAFVLFGVLVVWHARIEERITRHEALRIVNMRALARIARSWSELPEAAAPPGAEIDEHPFALDLDLFGRASLVQWLGPASTPHGRETLARWLVHPASKPEILARQAAIAELAGADGWRIVMAAHGVLTASARQAEIDRLLAWAEGESPFGKYGSVLQVAVFTLVLTLWGSIALYAIGAMPAALWPVPLLAGIILSFATGAIVHKTLERAGAGEQALDRYAAIFEHAVLAPRSAPLLQALFERISAEGAPAPRCMRRLNRILALGELRTMPILHFPVQSLTLWDFHVMFALERWRQASGRRVRAWLEALGELDALALLATAQRDNPGWAVPEIASAPEIVAEGIGHPLIPDDRRVANDVTVGPPGTLLLITGSNMSGKSTLLRSIGLNVVLAQAGGCVCARRMRLPECDLQTSIRVQDSLELGLSYFMAALARLKGVVDAAEHERVGRVLLYLLDEILQGTNSVERSIAVRAVSRHLLEAGAIGAMTTHDLGLAEEEPIKGSAKFWHFSETLDGDGTMRFDYTLKPGLATSRNALRLMQMIGIDL
ncbi:MAG TPA: MutS family DNA mismatch repair protein [Vicinamibacterales bacterium]|nr:MutS family DNA mismatch repair protein [Vicinamibacterales bacterium]